MAPGKTVEYHRFTHAGAEADLMQVSPAALEFRPIIGSVKKLRKLVIAGREARAAAQHLRQRPGGDVSRRPT
jgi:hypothetical protein